MLKPLGMFMTCFALALSQPCIAQKNTSKTIRKETEGLKNGNENITADKIVSDGDTITYSGNVSMTTTRFTARKARKAIVNRRTNQITIWGGKELRINRKTIVVDAGLPEDRFEYDLGSGVVRMFL